MSMSHSVGLAQCLHSMMNHTTSQQVVRTNSICFLPILSELVMFWGIISQTCHRNILRLPDWCQTITWTNAQFLSIGCTWNLFQNTILKKVIFFYENCCILIKFSLNHKPSIYQYMQEMCCRSLDLKFKAKLKLESANQKIQYGHQAAILKVTYLKINRLLSIHTSNVLLKFGVDIQS